MSITRAGVDLVGERIDVRHGAQPGRHQRQWIDGVAGEEDRHGQHLADAHEAFARLHDAGNDQRQRREQPGTEQIDRGHADQIERIKIDADAEHERQRIDDQACERPARRPKAPCPDQRRARRRADQIALQARRDRAPRSPKCRRRSPRTTRSAPGCRRRESRDTDIVPRHTAHLRHDLAEQQQPQHRLDRAGEQLEGIVTSFCTSAAATAQVCVKNSPSARPKERQP